MREIVIATRNEGKLREIRRILKDLDLRILSLGDISYLEELVEEGTTYLENAQMKSSCVAEVCGKIVLADDSGLEIDFLDGKPGVRSARFGGDGLDAGSKNELVLDMLKSVSYDKRTARFRCVISIQRPGGTELHCEGICEGFISENSRGDKGFGYDPIFFVPEYGKTMAELKPEEKNLVSHRAVALAKAKEILEGIL